MDDSGPDATRALVSLLQKAHAGELAAYLAYEGHWRSLQDPREKNEVRKIGREELVHREGLRGMLEELGAPPVPLREILFRLIGTAIGKLCGVGGWLVPMYGAGRLEWGNIFEYEEGARLAVLAGRPDLVEPLLGMAETEREHEKYFRGKVESHRLRRWIPLWPPPPSRTSPGGRVADERQSLASTSSMR